MFKNVILADFVPKQPLEIHNVPLAAYVLPLKSSQSEFYLK